MAFPDRAKSTIFVCLIIASVAMGVGCEIVSGEPAGALVTVNDHTFRVDIADTPKRQSKGLSGRRALAPDDGMLFVYTDPGDHTFWMRGMVISIDILWIRNYRVVHVEHNVPPPAPGTPVRELPVYRSREAANMVLEIAAGRAAELRIAPGSRVTYEFPKP